MTAARFHGRGDIRVDDVPDPQVGPGQVEVSVDWWGICGTDLHEFLEGPIFILQKGSPHPITGSELPVVTLVGSLAYCGDHADTIAMLRDGKVDAEQFITGRIGLADLVDRGFRELIDNKEENVKILVSPKEL
jgi:threonine dehydrogenase-like Zn-dependent dehydrogenase